jgi:hypothetical protein
MFHLAWLAMQQAYLPQYYVVSFHQNRSVGQTSPSQRKAAK